MPKKKKATATSSFGSAGRRSHDARQFYSREIYQDLSPSQAGQEAQSTTLLLPELLDQVYSASAEDMHELPDACLHLMVTSPPYNVGKEYDADLGLAEYLAFLKRVWQEVWRVLVPGGRACINIANLGRKPYIPLHAFLIRDMLDLGFLMRGEIIWDKGASAAASTAWGSWLSPSNPTLRDTHEYILVFSKDTFRRERSDGDQATINRDEFLTFTRSIWSFPAESARKIGHPAPFPLELPYRLIQLYTFAGDIVLDPFMGSGQTALAAIQSGRRFVGYEVDSGYVDLAKRRIREFEP